MLFRSELLHYDINFENILGLDTVQTSTNVDTKIKDVYVLGIEEKIKEDIENLGYTVEIVQVLVDENYENISEISLKVDNNKSSNDIKIEEVSIGKKENIKNQYNDIVSFLETNYSVEGNKIIIY